MSLFYLLTMTLSIKKDMPTLMLTFVIRSLALWTLNKKRPLVVIPNAHNESGSLANENWISSLATLQSTDLLASGT